MTRAGVAIAVALAMGVGGAACGAKAQDTTTIDTVEPLAADERVLALLPPGAQLVLEVDLARLRANAVVGDLVTRALDDGALASLPGAMPASPLAIADRVVLAAYGVGTSNAATVTLLALEVDGAADRGAKLAAVPGAIRVTDTLYALGPDEWVGQVEQRAVLSLGRPIRPDPELLALRGRAMPRKAPGASLRLAARLPFEARVSLAREIGIESAPAQLSVWADVVDDFVIIVDADAADPGEKASKKSAARLEAIMRGAIGGLAAEPWARALGIAASLGNAKLAIQGSWVRAIVAIGPARLQRVVERASTILTANTADRGPP